MIAIQSSGAERFFDHPVHLSPYYRVIKKFLCTWWLQYNRQAQRDFFDHPVHPSPSITDLCRPRSALKIQTHFNYPCITAPLWLSSESFVVHFGSLHTTLSIAESRLSPASTVVSFFVLLSIRQFYAFKTEKFPTYLHHAHPKELSVAALVFFLLYLVSAPGSATSCHLSQFLEGNFITNIIITLRINHNMHK